MARNGISSKLEDFRLFFLRTAIHIRLTFSICGTLFFSICTMGYLWIFLDQVAKSLMVIWIITHLHFLLLEAVMVVIPMQYRPFVILFWIVFGLPSSISPFNPSAGLDRVSHSLPCYQAHQVLLDIWSKDRDQHLFRTLPTLLL